MSGAEQKKKKSLEVESVFDAELEKYHNILGYKVKRVRGNGTLRTMCVFLRQLRIISWVFSLAVSFLQQEQQLI